MSETESPEPENHLLGSEDIARLLWERFAPEHEVDWPPTHAAEYRSVADDIIASICVTERREGWCQPGDIKDRQYLVTFDDPDCRNSVFSDEAKARDFWERMSSKWNCYLFGALPRSTSPQPKDAEE